VTGNGGFHRRAEDRERDEAREVAWEVFAEALKQRGLDPTPELRTGFLDALEEYEKERTTQALRRYGMAALKSERPIVSGSFR